MISIIYEVVDEMPLGTPPKPLVTSVLVGIVIDGVSCNDDGCTTIVSIISFISFLTFLWEPYWRQFV